MYAWTIVQRIVERDQTHALMVCHVRAHDARTRPARAPRRRIVNRFIEAVLTRRACALELLQIRPCACWDKRQREKSRIRRDDEIVIQFALECEFRHAEHAILVIVLLVGREKA